MNPTMSSLAIVWFPRLPFVLLGRLVGLLGVLLVVALYAVSLVWVYRDANRRGRNSVVVALLVALLFWPISLLVWLIIRERDNANWRQTINETFDTSHRITALIWALLAGALVLSILLGEWTWVAICIALAVAFKLALRGGLLRDSSRPLAPPSAIPPKIQPGPGRVTCPQCGTTLAEGAPQGLCPACLLRRGVPTEFVAPSGGERMMFSPPPPSDLAKNFPQLEILQFIGQGGMGAVYQARQPNLDRLVALKILPPQAGRDPGFAERFSREARALARLNHPNIVAIHDFGQAGEFYYLVMEYVDGTNLRQLERTRKLAPREALAIVPQICDALQFAHDEGVVHRDIKPENILVDRRGRVKIADFGLAKLLGQERKDFTITEANHVIGTPHYMAPEQVEHPQHVDHRADIYSLGVVFYEMLTGELPIGRFPTPSQKVHVDVRLDEVVLRALEKEPERRYQQASVMKTEVETIVTTPPPVIPPPQPAPAPSTLPVEIGTETSRMGVAQRQGQGLVPSGEPATSVSDTAPAPVVSGPAVGQPRIARPSAGGDKKNVSDKRILPAFLLALLFGVFGVHRFYVGKIGTGILQLCTLGGLGIWVMIDWILILCGAFSDKQGNRITRWI
jgi:serine/threonine protein kinase/TM2 domain-containing membrane protein YozV